MIKLLHAADLHLDSAFAALRPQQAQQYRQEQRDTVRRLFRLAEDTAADLILFSGDLFDSDNAYADTIELLLSCCRQSRAQIFMAPGNHDWLMAGSAYLCAPWPENVHIFKSNQVQSVTLPELGIRVYGAGFCGKWEKAMLSDFHAPRDGLLNLMVLHGDCTAEASSYNPITHDQIAASGLHYLALGHIHKASGLLKAGSTFYAWPGCAMGRGFDETGEKGVYLGTVTEDGVQLSFAPLKARRYEVISADVTGGAEAAVEEALQNAPEGCNLRLILTGQAEDLSLSRLQRQYEDRFSSLELQNRTTPGRELWQGMEEDSLRGIFLRNMKKRYDLADSDAQREVITLAVQLGMDAMEGRELRQ